MQYPELVAWIRVRGSRKAPTFPMFSGMIALNRELVDFLWRDLQTPLLDVRSNEFKVP